MEGFPLQLGVVFVPYKFSFVWRTFENMSISPLYSPPLIWVGCVWSAKFAFFVWKTVCKIHDVFFHRHFVNQGEASKEEMINLSYVKGRSWNVSCKGFIEILTVWSGVYTNISWTSEYQKIQKHNSIMMLIGIHIQFVCDYSSLLESFAHGYEQ